MHDDILKLLCSQLFLELKENALSKNHFTCNLFGVQLCTVLEMAGIHVTGGPSIIKA